MASLLRSGALTLARSRSRVSVSLLRSQAIKATQTTPNLYCLRWSSAATSPASPTQAQTTPESSSITINGKEFSKDEWFNVPPHVAAATSRRLHLQKDHPLCITRQIIESKFPSTTFKYHNTFDPVVSTYENFDSLGFPPNHPGRARSDTYYINKDTLLRTHTSAHELDLFRRYESQGYLISADVYRRDEIDRTHYPVFHQMEGARLWDRAAVPNGDIAAAVWADLEKLPKHDVVVEDPNPPHRPERNPVQSEHHSPAEAEAIAAHLKRTLELVVVDIFTRASRAARKASEEDARLVAEKAYRMAAKKAARRGEDPPAMPEPPAPAEEEPLRMRWVEAYFPFTSPSWELEVYYNGDWLEVLGCGVTQQRIYVDAGQPTQLGWAFGLGLDRIAMLLFQIPDIRLFWSRDKRFLHQFRNLSEDPSYLEPFRPFSKYPGCKKDLSFWLPVATESWPTLHENDLMEIVRSIAGNDVEAVTRTDEFVHPETGRRSLLYRVVYRSLERTLRNIEINKLHRMVAKELVGRYGVEMR